MKIEAFYLRSEGEMSGSLCPRGRRLRMNASPGETPGKNAEKVDSLHLTHHEKDQCSAGQ
ncbi:TPA: hypothetical protein MH611_25850 [Klebsiella pneumoniae]|nr:hypothetical protein A9493_23080 [Klebsiella pneumoniae]ROE89577.1 hypothetical protein C4Y86_004320 [Klebsiella pneumoniae subsp. pneumoniae]AVI89576.1 hypothetical protein CW753_08040 [Klebsiella pneumoniae]AWC97523.1 hypothetical protein AM388_07710 [Klebsiella pneumoniae]AWD95239.1 hypothetical protein AM389_07980 [Klebsiella pneumoniae]